MASMNEFSFIGRVGRDPEFKSFQSGGRVCNLSVATSDSWQDKQSGEWKDRTQWHRITVFNEHLIAKIERSITKGSLVAGKGALEYRKFEKDGQEHMAAEIVMRPFRGDIMRLDKRDDGESGPQGGDYERAGTSGGRDGRTQLTGSAALDDEIPF